MVGLPQASTPVHNRRRVSATDTRGAAPLREEIGAYSVLGFVDAATLRPPCGAHTVPTRRVRGRRRPRCLLATDASLQSPAHGVDDTYRQLCEEAGANPQVDFISSAFDTLDENERAQLMSATTLPRGALAWLNLHDRWILARLVYAAVDRQPRLTC